MHMRIMLALMVVLLAAVPGRATFAQESHIMHAHGSFEVRMVPQTPDNPPAQAAGLGRLSLDKDFHGDLAATGQGEMLAVRDESQKQGAYVAMERVTGTLGGREGSFVLVHRALLRGGQPQEWTVTVVPGSGTQALAGIEGSMRIRIEDGRHLYDLDYTLSP